VSKFVVSNDVKTLPLPSLSPLSLPRVNLVLASRHVILLCRLLRSYEKWELTLCQRLKLDPLLISSSKLILDAANMQKLSYILKLYLKRKLS